MLVTRLDRTAVLKRITFAAAISTAAFLSVLANPFSSLSGISSAQAGSTTIGGKRMSCSRAEVVKSNKSQALAYAEAGRIVINPSKLRRYPSITQRIIFLHECGHQYVGLDETEADCWAVRAGKRRGWLTLKGVNTVCRSFRNDPGSSVHLPGPARCRAMKLCFNSTKGRRKR